MGPLVYGNDTDPVSWMMEYHSDYLQKFLKAQSFLLREDGPLPYDYRHYIAIIAAARHNCTYLVKLHEQEFLLHGGNPDWLKGIDHAPSKIQDLYEINKILAHQPWLMSKDHIAKLQAGLEPWSLSEVMQAIILLANFHSVCSFVYGCGISSHLDMHSNTHQQTPNSDGETPDCSDSDSDVESRTGFHLQVSLKDTSSNTLTEQMNHLTGDAAVDYAASVPKMRKPSLRSENLRYMKSSDFSYSDFITHHYVSEIPTFRACDYSWDDHGFSLASCLYPGIENLLDDKFNMAANMSCSEIEENLGTDPTSFCQAIWNYIHCVYGIMHDDYNYSEVNQLLEKNFKAYIKTVTCYPERLQRQDELSLLEIRSSVKVCINLILMEARQQAELLYALRALSQYIT